jgi:hypothetical protein
MQGFSPEAGEGSRPGVESPQLIANSLRRSVEIDPSVLFV